MWFEQLLWCFEKSFPDAQKVILMFLKLPFKVIGRSRLIRDPGLVADKSATQRVKKVSQSHLGHF